MENSFKDIRYGFRGLLKRPAFTIIALVILALGIGANTAIFTLLNAVVLKPLPVHKPDELVLFNDVPSEGTSPLEGGDTPTGRTERFSYAAYRYFREHDSSFQELSAFRGGESRISVRRPETQAGQAAERASAHLVSGNYFTVLGVNAMQGRVLTNEDDASAAMATAVISNSYWQQKLNSDPQIVGKNILLNGTVFTIVGVMPPEFFGTRVRRSPDFWMPLVFQPQIELRKSYLDDKNVYWLNMIGRLKPGVQLAQAQAAANVELRQYLTERAGSQLNDDNRLAIQNSYVTLASGARGLSGLRFFYSQALRMLMVIVALVLSLRVKEPQTRKSAVLLLASFAHADGDSRAGAFDCLRQCWESSVVARSCETSGDFFAAGFRREPRPAGSSTANGKLAPCRNRRSRGDHPSACAK